MTEQDMWNVIRKKLQSAGHVVRIESHATSIGVPDVHYCIDGNQGWIELKQSPTKSAPKVRPSQVQWIHKEVNNGGVVWVLAHLRSDYGKNAWVMIPGEHILELSKTKHAVNWWKYISAAYLDEPDMNSVINLLKVT